MSTEKSTSTQGAVKVNGAKTEKKKEMKREEGPKILAPTLPGSMKHMLADEKDEDKDLVFITVTFYRRNVTEVSFGVRNDKGDIEKKSPLEYDMFKESRRRVNKTKSEEEAAKGWAKSLGHRCLIFAKDVEGLHELLEMKSIAPPPIVKSMMAKTQKEFRLEFPTEDKVVDYWVNQAPKVLEEVETYAEKLGADYRKNLGSLKDLMKKRAEKKAEKASKPPDSKEKTKKEEPSSAKSKSAAQTVPKGTKWGDEEDAGSKAKEGKVKPPAPKVNLDRAVQALKLFVTEEELSKTQSNVVLSKVAEEIGFPLAMESKKYLDTLYEQLAEAGIVRAAYTEEVILENCEKAAIAAAATLGIPFD